MKIYYKRIVILSNGNNDGHCSATIGPRNVDYDGANHDHDTSVSVMSERKGTGGGGRGGGCPA